MNIEQFDERQKAIRNKIMTKAFALAIILLCGAIILNECKVIEIGKTVSFTDYGFITFFILILYVTLSLIWKDAYVVIVNAASIKIALYGFSVLSILDIDLFIKHRMEQAPIDYVVLAGTITMIAITISLWLKKIDWDN